MGLDAQNQRVASYNPAPPSPSEFFKDVNRAEQAVD
jgi:hypothetical protein